MPTSLSGWACVSHDRFGKAVRDDRWFTHFDEALCKQIADTIVGTGVKVQHQGWPIGHVIAAQHVTKEQARQFGKAGVFVTVAVFCEQTLKRIKAGELTGFSVGGEGVIHARKETRGRYVKVKSTRRHQVSMDINELSLTDCPANPYCKIEGGLDERAA